MKPCAVVYNPNSGKGKNKTKIIDYIGKTLKKQDYQATFFSTSKRGDAKTIVSALDDNYQFVILVGGDGTLNEGIAGNMSRKHKLVLAQLPIGTTNDVGTMYGYTKNYKKNLHLLLNGMVVPIDTCSINSKPFIYVACFGNYVDVSYKTPRKLKEKFGKLGYVLYGSKKIKSQMRSYHIEYEIDGQKKEDIVSFIFITNGSRVAGIKNICENVKLDDGIFEIVFLKAKRKRELISLLPTLLTGKSGDHLGICHYKASHLKLKLNEIVEDSWCLDGEEYHTDQSVFEFGVQNEMKMLVPRKNIKKLFQKDLISFKGNICSDK